jgi:hypothetical protein
MITEEAFMDIKCITPSSGEKWSSLSEFVKELKLGMSRFYNKRHGRRGAEGSVQESDCAVGFLRCKVAMCHAKPVYASLEHCLLAWRGVVGKAKHRQWYRFCGRPQDMAELFCFGQYPTIFVLGDLLEILRADLSCPFHL